MLNVRVGTIEFEGSPRDPGDAFMISPDGWSGWDDGPSVRRDDVTRPGQHGSFVAPGFRDARVITISGWILAGSPSELLRKRDRLMGLLATGGQGRMTVQRGDGPGTRADVQLAEAPVVKVRGASELEAEFQIVFWAADPRKYGETYQFESGDVVYHYGNFPAPVEVTIPSAPAGYSITSPAGTFAVAGATSGGTHVVDLRTGRVTRNGTLMLGVSSGPTWEVPPGPGWLHTVTAAGAQIRVTEAYM